MATRTPPPDDAPADWRVAVGDTSPQTADDDEDLSIVEKFRVALGETPTDKARVRLFRIAPDSGNMEFCRDMQMQQFLVADMLERVRGEWGAGEFEFMLIGPRGTLKRARHYIAAPFGPAPISSPATNAPQNDALAQALTMIAQGQAAILQAINQRPDPREEMKAQLEMLAAMRATHAASACVSGPVAARCGRA